MVPDCTAASADATPAGSTDVKVYAGTAPVSLSVTGVPLGTRMPSERD